MTKKLIAIGCAFFLFQFTQAQSYTLSGTVMDQNSNKPLEYSAVSILNSKNNAVIEGGLTDANGRFELRASKGIYTLKIDYISFETHIIENLNIQQNMDLGKVVLKINTQELENIEVIGQKTEVEIRLDKRIYNVGKDLTIRGGTVSDVLDNVPSVSVDFEGNIALRGNQNVRVLINGKPSGLFGISGAEALRQLPAETVDKVEVITSPSARYEAEGTAGIINIVLLKNRKGGFNGSLTSNIGIPETYGISGNINYRTDSYNLFLITGFRDSKSLGNSYFETDFFNPLGDDKLIEDRIFDRNNINLNYNTGIEFFFSEQTSLTTSVIYYDRDYKNIATNKLFSTTFDEDTIESERKEVEKELDNSLEFNLNLVHNFNDEGHNLSFDIQKEDSEEIEKGQVFVREIVPNPSAKLGEKVITEESFDQLLMQIDYVNPYSKNGQFEAGYRGVIKERTIGYEVEDETILGNFEVNTQVSNTLEYQENIHAVYSQIGNKLGRFTYFLGLRFEHTEIDIFQKTSKDTNHKSYGDFFPTLNLSYEWNETESLTLGYNRRISRPRGRFINPYPSRSSATNIFQGNPNIAPSYSNGIDLGYLKRFDKSTLSGSVYFRKETDVFTYVLEETNDQVMVGETLVPVIRRYPINLASRNNLGIEINASSKISKKWRVNGNLNFFKIDLNGSHNNKVYDKEDLNFSGRFSNTYTLPKNIDWQTNMYYRGPTENAQNKSKAYYNVSTALSKDVFDEKGTITLRLSDVFNSSRRRWNSKTESLQSYGEFQWREPTYSLNFTYRFNQKKKREGQRSNQDQEFNL